MKLHLGCGQNYLQGYVNIDFPSSSHSVQEASVADLQADILSLRYEPGTIEEIRLHHVFEHFPRPLACALLAGWFSWLKIGGLLHIEVPDFQKTARVILSAFTSFKKKVVAERHLFGSHEAHWAIHCEGYTPTLLKNMLKSFGFTVIKTKKNSWCGTYNCEIFAEKISTDLSTIEFERITENYLRKFLLNDQENRLLEVWLKTYKEQVDRSWAHHE